MISQILQGPLSSSEAAQELEYLFKEQSSSLPVLDDGLAELFIDDLLDRALTYGRIKADSFQSTWAGLDIGNIDVGGTVKVSGGILRVINNSKWDAKGFLRKAELAYKQRELEEGQSGLNMTLFVEAAFTPIG